MPQVEKIAKNYLLKYKTTLEYIDRLQARLEELEEAKADLHGANYSRPRVTGAQSTEAYFVKILARIDEIKTIKRETERKAQRIRNKLTGIIGELSNDRSRDILTKLYINLESWNDIFNHGEVTERTFYNWHRQALKEFYNILRKNKGTDPSPLK